MRKITQEELNKILENHARWLSSMEHTLKEHILKEQNLVEHTLTKLTLKKQNVL